MNKFLVTGAMGFIGSHWCKFLLENGKTVYGMDLEPTAPELLEYKNFIFIHDTIKNHEILQNAVNQVDCVCHFAGIAEPYQYLKYPRKVIDITAVAGIQLIEMCRVTGKLFFFTSTSEIYGKNTKVPFKEEDDRVLGATTSKRWCYASSKAIVEHYLDACAMSKELDYLVVRLFNVYGPGLRGRVVSNLIDNALRGEELVLHGDGKQTRCYTYIDDVIEAFNLLLFDRNCYNQVFNIGNKRETSVIELAESVKNSGQFSSDIKFLSHNQCYGEGFEDISIRVPDISKLQKYTGWEPKTTLEEGLSKSIKHRKNELTKIG